ncbi:hypothetical protein, partial [Granulicella aggregans]|uniref:hypothetical protein n=1 Tax=Granulicella aggregans TaxID=474949 RepID=UPI0021DFD3A5
MVRVPEGHESRVGDLPNGLPPSLAIAEIAEIVDAFRVQFGYGVDDCITLTKGAVSVPDWIGIYGSSITETDADVKPDFRCTQSEFLQGLLPRWKGNIALSGKEISGKVSQEVSQTDFVLILKGLRSYGGE